MRVIMAIKGRRHKMDKHTFKVGDRVIYTDSSLKTHVGAKGQYWEGTHDGGTLTLPGVKFDNDNLNRLVYNREFFSVRSHDSLKHDIDFREGDWVRYEGITNSALAEVEGYVGQVMAVDTDCIQVDFPNYANNKAFWCIENLVKIQPPQDESDNTIIHVFTSYTNKEEKMDKKEEQIDIVHKETGEIVRDVENVMNPRYSWKKVQNDRVVSFSIEHWKRYEEWVKIEVRKSQWDNVNKCCNMLEVQKKSEDYPDTCTLSWRYPQ